MDKSQKVKIFLTGATGYIGGSVLTKLLDPSISSRWDISVLTRSESTVEKFKELGVTPILGSLDDEEVLVKACAAADVVINTADADHMPATKAIVKGCSEEGKKRILIHTSGTGELCDDAKGDSESDFFYSDKDMKTIHDIPVTRLHKDVDYYIFENNQKFDSIIICPPTIYGLGLGPFNKHSVQMPMWIKTYIKTGYVGTVGKGLNWWNNVHVEDLANFYVLVLEKALEGKASTGKDGWYFCESGQHQLKDLVAKIGEELHKAGAIKSAEVTTMKSEDVDKYFGPIGGWLCTGGNSRCKAEKARELGWKHDESHGTIFDSVQKEVETILKNSK